MKKEALSMFSKARHAASDYVTKQWEEKVLHKTPEGNESSDPAKISEAEEARLRAEKDVLLQQVAGKLAGVSASEMPALRVDPDTSHRAVYLVTVPIAYGNFELSKRSFDLVARHVGMTLDTVSHWALGIIDRGLGICWCYDLMSDQIALSMLGKNYLRVYEIDQKVIQTWSSCYYIGETTKSHEEIQSLGNEHLAINPRYNILDNNCQDLVENLVKSICDGKLVSQSKLGEELSHLSPKMARDLMVARLRAKLDVNGEHEESDGVKSDVDIIKALWTRVRHKTPPPEGEKY